ncbi:MAG: hypothetical protein ABIO46_11590, partial [Chitinophagales bacterium]
MNFRFILPALLLIFTTQAVAQNWNIFPAYQRNVYISTEKNDAHYVYAYRADSFLTAGTDSIIFFNQKPFDESDPYCYSHFESNYDFNLYRDPFYMDSILLAEDHYEINIGETTVSFFHLATLNQSWKVKSSTPVILVDSTIIQCTFVGEEEVLGTTDSIKIFSITAYNDGQVIPEFSAYQYKLSRSFGLTEFVPFRYLIGNDYSPGGITKLLLQRVEIDGQVYGFSFPSFEDYFSQYTPGDVQTWSRIKDWWDFMEPATGAFYKDSFVNVTQTYDSICICFHRWQKDFTVGLSDTVYKEYNTSRCILRYQFEPLLQLASGQYTFGINDYAEVWQTAGALQAYEVRIDSSGPEVNFFVTVSSGDAYYLDTLTCEVGIIADAGATFKMNTSDGIYFYGH